MKRKSSTVRRAGRRSSTSTVRRERHIANAVRDPKRGSHENSYVDLPIEESQTTSSPHRRRDDEYDGTRYLVIPLLFDTCVVVTLRPAIPGSSNFKGAGS